MGQFLASWGYAAIMTAILADSFGVPIPGEAMLLLASVYAGTTHHLALPLVIVTAAVGAMVGDNITYTLGRRGGYPVLVRHGRFLHIGEHRLIIGQYLFRRYGGAVVLVGRFIPVLHIWTAVLAGVNQMPRLRFVLANSVGAVVWATALGLAGYAVGRAVLRSETVFGAAAVPFAVAIGVGVVLVLRANERRLYEAAERDARARERQPT
jgi:membrane protein DedA with SNARE-associated domain